MLLPLDQLDRVVDGVGGELFELLLRQLDVLERVDDLVVGEESLFLPLLDELVQFLDVWQSDLDGEHEPLLLSGLTKTSPHLLQPLADLPRPAPTPLQAPHPIRAIAAVWDTTSSRILTSPTHSPWLFSTGTTPSSPVSIPSDCEKRAQVQGEWRGTSRPRP